MSTPISVRAPSQADRIAADGVTIMLKGERHVLRFGLRAFRYIENEFESLDAFLVAVQQETAGKDLIRATCAGIIAGLLHEKPADVALDVFEEQVAELLEEGGSLREWLFAMSKALIEAMPAPQGGPAGPKAAGSRASSRGTAGTSSRRATAARTRSSGR